MSDLDAPGMGDALERDRAKLEAMGQDSGPRVIDLMAALKESVARGPEPIDVVAAVRSKIGGDNKRRYWVCRRTRDGANAGLAGMWEYPGGKVEPGEELEAALAREMKEEFGVEGIHVDALLDVIETTAAGKAYRVHFFAVTFYGTPRFHVHDAAEWYTAEELSKQQHLPSGTEFNRRLLAR